MLLARLPIEIRRRVAVSSVLAPRDRDRFDSAVTRGTPNGRAALIVIFCSPQLASGH
jgi:hypothetical protein